MGIAVQERSDCAICAGPSFFLRTANSHPIFKCLHCGLEFCSPMPSQAEITAFYDAYSDPRASLEVVERNGERNLAALEGQLRLSPASRILDFGCGQNAFIRLCRRKGYTESWGVDPYTGAGGDPWRLSWGQCLERRWDLIVLWGVLEHLADPLETLRALGALTAAGSCIAATTLSIETPIPFQYKPPEHTLYFTRRSLEILGKRAGLRLQRHEPYRMIQDADVYLSILLRTMPQEYRSKVHHGLEKYLEVPTNEVFVTFGKGDPGDPGSLA